MIHDSSYSGSIHHGASMALHVLLVLWASRVIGRYLVLFSGILRYTRNDETFLKKVSWKTGFGSEYMIIADWVEKRFTPTHYQHCR
jgi:hypothetical protein